MEFFVILHNRYGSFGINAIAAQLDLKLGRRGDFVGWVDRDGLELIAESGYSYEVR